MTAPRDRDGLLEAMENGLGGDTIEDILDAIEAAGCEVRTKQEIREAHDTLQAVLRRLPNSQKFQSCVRRVQGSIAVLNTSPYRQKS